MSGKHSREYKENYRVNNKDRISAYNREYYLANREYIKARNAAWAAANRERKLAINKASKEKRKSDPEVKAKNRAYGKAYYEANKHRIDAERKREIYKRWAARNPERVRELRRQARLRSLQKDPELFRLKKRGADIRFRNAHKDRTPSERRRVSQRISQNKRRSRKLFASGSFTREDWMTLVARSPKCHYCGCKWSKRCRPTHDHVIPLSKGGQNTLNNSVCSCRGCNSSKQNKLYDPVSKQGILL